MSSTPRADAVRAWLDAKNWSAPLVLPERQSYENPSAWNDPAVRLNAALRMCGGAPALLPAPKRRIPPPPKRKKGPK